MLPGGGHGRHGRAPSRDRRVGGGEDRPGSGPLSAGTAEPSGPAAGASRSRGVGGASSDGSRAARRSWARARSCACWEPSGARSWHRRGSLSSRLASRSSGGSRVLGMAASVSTVRLLACERAMTVRDRAMSAECSACTHPVKRSRGSPTSRSTRSSTAVRSRRESRRPTRRAHHHAPGAGARQPGLQRERPADARRRARDRPRPLLDHGGERLGELPAGTALRGHHGSRRELALAHNGNLINAVELHDELVERGIELQLDLRLGDHRGPDRHGPGRAPRGRDRGGPPAPAGGLLDRS